MMFLRGVNLYPLAVCRNRKSCVILIIAASSLQLIKCQDLKTFEAICISFAEVIV